MDFLKSWLGRILNAKASGGLAIHRREKQAFPKHLKTSIQTNDQFSMRFDDFLCGIYRKMSKITKVQICYPQFPQLGFIVR